ncbi:hypothetical protein [Gilvimarinus sp. DA14]|uniref:hypothetical protein n=1 Tax=Gilvimarinus sp. DA14 TaxID=2956798 RepID=UPI0020B6B629|nr:hypothetical protein [Gilvimarinus sp. DA14]UTF60701.1 hypothetical protein NHM04_02560 [Gilvimarinus sp. DA14]
MYRFAHMLAFLTALLLSVFARGESDPYAIGEAYKLDDRDELVYREQYYDDGNAHHRVLYFSPEQELIARKTLNYSNSETAPDFRFEDLRFELILEAKNIDGEIALSKSAAGEQESGRVDLAERQVIDAGFVAMIQQHFTELEQGLEFSFAFPGRLKNISLRAITVDFAATPFTQRQSNYTYLKMELNNRFFAMFLDPIYLAFDSDKRLSGYAGRSNLTDSDNQAFDVLIQYRYPPQSSQ